MKNVVIDSVQFIIGTRYWNNETLGAFVRALVDSAIQDGAEVSVIDSYSYAPNYDGVCLDKDMTIGGESSFSYLQERDEGEKV